MMGVFDQYQNFGLLFHKPSISHLYFDPYEEDAKMDRKIGIDSGEKNKYRNTIVYPLKSKGLNDHSSLADFPFDEVGIDFEEHCQGLQKSAEDLLPRGSWQSQVFVNEQALAIGMGTASFYENGIQLHHLYGFPYLPASSIKGAVRHWTIYRYFDASEKQALADLDFCRLFGDNAEGKAPYPNVGRSHLIFWDAFPLNAPSLKVDILNTHFKDYYAKEKAAPTDNQKPNPIYFLTVAAGVPFQFLLGQKRPGLLQTKLAEALPLELFGENEKTQLLRAGHYLLAECLWEWGIGAKTALGYGRFEPLEEVD